MCKSSNTTTTIQQPEIPEWLETAFQGVVEKAGQVAQTPFNPATMRNVAGFSGDQQAAFNMANQMVGNWQPHLNTAADYATTAGSTIAPTAINQYMNPFQSQVIDATMANISQNNALQQQQLQGNAALQGALGGDRVKVAQAELARQQGLATNQTLANLNAQNYNQALGAAQADRTAAGNAATQFGALANQVSALGAGDYSRLLAQGGLQQGLAQQQLDTASANAAMQSQYPFAVTGWEQGVYTGAAPSFTGYTSSSTQPAPNPVNSLLGLGAMGLGAFLSDERAKEDIEPVGELYDGTTVYKYKMVGDPRTQIGVMAQEVEHRTPEAVHEVGGLKLVNYDTATKKSEGLAARKGYAEGGWVFPGNLVLGGRGRSSQEGAPPYRVNSYVPATGSQLLGAVQQPPLAKPPPPPKQRDEDQDDPVKMFNEARKAAQGLNAGLGQIVGKLDTTQGPGGWSTSVQPTMAGLGNYLGNAFGMARGGRVGYQQGGEVDPNQQMAAQMPAGAPQAGMAGAPGMMPQGMPMPPAAPPMGLGMPMGGMMPGAMPPGMPGPMPMGGAPGPMPALPPPGGMQAPMPPPQPQGAGLGQPIRIPPRSAPYGKKVLEKQLSRESKGLAKARDGFQSGGVVDGYYDPEEDIWKVPQNVSETSGSSIGTDASAPAAPSMWDNARSGQYSWLAEPLIAAGAAMMASRSPFVGPAIGEGGLAGIKAYREAQKAEALERRAREQMAEQKRMNDLRAREIEARLKQIEDPNLPYEQRAAVLQRFGIDPNSAEGKAFILTGDLPSARGRNITAEAQEREALAIQMGLEPGTPAFQSYVLTGKTGRDEPLTITEKKAIMEADEAVEANRMALTMLSEAEKLNDQTNEGLLARERATLGAYMPDWMVPDAVSSPESSQATIDYENVVIGQALNQLKAIFGGMPTEGERKILIDLQGSVNQPKAVRREILRRARAMAERRLRFNEEKARALRSQEYYKTDRGIGAPSGDAGSSEASQIIEEARDAIAKGAPREQVIERLRNMGIDPSGL